LARRVGSHELSGAQRVLHERDPEAPARAHADDAWDDVQALLCWHPQSIDIDLLQNGREIERRFKLSWWDSLIVASAQSQNCTVLLSEDLQDGATYGGVTVRSPFTLSINEAAASYTARTPRSRHPPRGRPRKSVEPSLTTESRE